MQTFENICMHENANNMVHAMAAMHLNFSQKVYLTSNNNAWVLSNVYTGLADLQFFCACITGRELVNPTETAGFHSHQCNVKFSCTKVAKY